MSQPQFPFSASSIMPQPSCQPLPTGAWLPPWGLPLPLQLCPHPFILGLGCDTLPQRRLILGMARQDVLEEQRRRKLTAEEGKSRAGEGMGGMATTPGSQPECTQPECSD